MSPVALWKWLALWLMAMLLVGLGAWGAAGIYRPQLEELGRQLAESRSRAEASLLALQKQNAALAELEARAAERARQVEQLQVRAAQVARQDYAAAARVMLEPPQVGVDACESARRAFADELKRERGQ
ncbi:hypothetical protein TUM18999_42250 [Pseudomonas tohonis]|uniref:DUF2570 domain-containing protein n=1 Tax=Pseudomonas tohonis TaxID=2725477 RepID=A0A6J4EAJ7_9PSED|nr:hypothetical protein [Pseudomonas tohonis]BCG26034.1 hypothetical protein TUM18999_42250 [Pseudomonas tohonis]GJN51235.1 hypothetical protein TUM20286_09870 [Pseudomonas tohonis]